MEYFKKHGSKERLFEMMGHMAPNVNEMQTPETKEILHTAFVKLKQGALKAEQGGSVEAKMMDNYVGINGFDAEGNMYNFNFKIAGEEGAQDGVEMVNNVMLEKFYYQNPMGVKVIELEENDLEDFNSEHGTDLFDVIEEYIDVQPPETPDDNVEDGVDNNIEVEMDETMIPKKEDSDPFGGARQEYQDGMGYGDEKPVNPKLRVDAPELKKFVQEDDVQERSEAKPINYDELAGEKLLQAKHNTLVADLEYAKLATAYENFLKVKKIDFKPSEVLDRALAAARDVVAEYLQTVKGLEVTEEDVQNHFQSMLSKYGSVIAETEEIEVEKSEEKPEGWADVDGFFQDDGGVMKWTEKPEGDDASTLEIPVEEPEAEMSVAVDEPSLDPDDSDGDGERIEGGVADGEDVMKYEPDQILKGIEVEMEHTTDPKVALEIAMDHLQELPDYYTRLDGMEKEGEADLDGGVGEPKMDGSGRGIQANMGRGCEDIPDELKGHFDDIKSAEVELAGVGGEEPLIGGPQASDEPLSMGGPPTDAAEDPHFGGMVPFTPEMVAAAQEPEGGEMPDELQGHADGIDSADKELEDAMLGFTTNTPNANKDE